ncbi:hypothetical protein [Achromobacter animicus]|uniref:hypothetical protein n=1 Tax=Achromobacter animicus TaxID=1389935 RepID=UPI00244AEE84|nr:hypothetical protein [Achromobacter animicus]MDH0683422.1 hypothetical protein [Achromobacter animicus]
MSLLVAGSCKLKPPYKNERQALERSTQSVTYTGCLDCFAADYAALFSSHSDFAFSAAIFRKLAHALHEALGMETYDHFINDLRITKNGELPACGHSASLYPFFLMEKMVAN